MIAFTDEDLKRLREDIEACDLLGHSGFIRASLNHMDALLSRLEKAEYALMRFSIIPKEYWTSGIEEAIEAWQASKGEAV